MMVKGMQREVEKSSTGRWIEELSRAGPDGKNAGLWKYVHSLASRPRRSRIKVNLSDLYRFGKEGENIIVPGKVLGGGAIRKGLNIAAVEYSAGAREKIIGANGKVLGLEEMMKRDGVRVII